MHKLSKVASALGETPAEPPITPKVYSILETARLLGVGQASVYTLMRTGRLRKIKILGRTLITATEIDRFLSALETEAAS